MGIGVWYRFRVTHLLQAAMQAYRPNNLNPIFPPPKYSVAPLLNVDWIGTELAGPAPYTNTLERLGEILVLQRVWITLRQQLPGLWQLRLYPLYKKGTFRRNLSAAACMDYTSPTTARMSEPRSGASCRAVVEISECNSYMSQRLDSLRSDFFIYKSTA